MSNRLEVHTRLPAGKVDGRFLQQIIQAALSDLPGVSSFQLEINVIEAAEMTRLNETFLGHRGATDVLAFDYAEPSPKQALRGEIFVCLDEAYIQARRFRTTWQAELVRYTVHGILHLMGFDDHHPARRRKMKRLENNTLRTLAARFPFARLRPPASRRKPLEPARRST